MGWRWGRSCLVEKWGAVSLSYKSGACCSCLLIPVQDGAGRQILTGNRKTSTVHRAGLSRQPLSTPCLRRRALQLEILALRVYTLLIETDRVKMLKHDTFARQPTGALLCILSLRHWLPLDRLGLCLLHSDRFNFRYRAVFRASISNSGTLPSRGQCVFTHRRTWRRACRTPRPGLSRAPSPNR